jgi:uncharacterized surface protein with fasciclin (FAS1) repeats
MLLQPLVYFGIPLSVVVATLSADMRTAVPPPIIGQPLSLPALRGAIPKGAPTIMDVVLGASDLTVLMTAIMKTDIPTTLSRPGPMTLFAPANAAFDRLPPSARAALMDPANMAILTRVLRHHIVVGTLTVDALAAQIKAGGGSTKLIMMSGDSITATTDAVSIILTDGAGNASRITKNDQREANGVVQIVDSLLLPQPKKQ